MHVLQTSIMAVFIISIVTLMFILSHAMPTKETVTVSNSCVKDFRKSKVDDTILLGVAPVYCVLS